MTPSGRPSAICVAVVDNDESWTSRITKDLGESLGASVEVQSVQSAARLQGNGHAPCHVLVLSRSSDPDLRLLHALRARFSDRELPIIVTDDDDEFDEFKIEATRAGANAFIDRGIHSDTNLLGKLVYSLAHE